MIPSSHGVLVRFWSGEANYFLTISLPRPSTMHPRTLAIKSTSIESPHEKQSVEIPTCYAPFSDVFCPKRASQLPPHRPWDCAIDLILGESVSLGRIYSLYIHPSRSPAASSFFFVAKKDGSLKPCIEYRALNKIRVKFRYPLPLVPAAL